MKVPRSFIAVNYDHHDWTKHVRRKLKGRVFTSDEVLFTIDRFVFDRGYNDHMDPMGELLCFTTSDILHVDIHTFPTKNGKEDINIDVLIIRVGEILHNYFNCYPPQTYEIFFRKIISTKFTLS